MWKLPPYFPPGDYWVAITRRNGNEIIGQGPEVDGSTAQFSVVRLICSAHEQCDSGHYCDKGEFCYPCSGCVQARDAIDGTCPSSCGSTVVLQPGGSIPNTSEDEASGASRQSVFPFCTANTVTYEPLVGSFVDVSEGLEVSVRMAGALNVLELRLKDAGLSTRVTRGLLSRTSSDWQSHNPDTVELHASGRAVDITMERQEDVSIETLSRVASIVSQAGMDWVQVDPSGQEVHASVVADSCVSKLDLIFLLDGSASIESPYSGGNSGSFDQALEFVSEVVGFFDIGPTATQVRLVFCMSFLSNYARSVWQFSHPKSIFNFICLPQQTRPPCKARFVPRSFLLEERLHQKDSKLSALKCFSDLRVEGLKATSPPSS